MKKSQEHSKLWANNTAKPSLLAQILIGLVYVYRFTLSPIFGNSCRFYPTCSQYSIDALTHYGAFRGSMMSVKRLLRCHPWHEGGYDPVPYEQNGCRQSRKSNL